MFCLTTAAFAGSQSNALAADEIQVYNAEITEIGRV